MSENQLSTQFRVGLLVSDPLRLAGLGSICSSLKQLAVVNDDFDGLISDYSLRFIVVDLSSEYGAVPQRVEVIRRIRKQRPDLKQIAIGEENDELTLEAILAGARAYLDINASPLTVSKAFEEVDHGTIWARRIVLSRVIDRLVAAPQAHAVVAEPATASNSKLTERERQVIDLILQASSNREIAVALGIEERTVKAHLGHLMRKVGVSNRVELSVWAIKQNIQGNPRLQADLR